MGVRSAQYLVHKPVTTGLSRCLYSVSVKNVYENRPLISVVRHEVALS